jgi:ketosteroid isomerase-like protein
MTVQQWVDTYAQAWRDRDPDAAARLFTDDARYRDHPLREPHGGAEGVHSYWADVTSIQDRSTFGWAARSNRRTADVPPSSSG